MKKSAYETAAEKAARQICNQYLPDFNAMSVAEYRESKLRLKRVTAIIQSAIDAVVSEIREGKGD